ncbi:MAG: tetratricopeptide repeat protein [Chthonomonadaceae bacterium]|nr:tetratricopeptide repeat protein [Chthonomonadaceae bacterium]
MIQGAFLFTDIEGSTKLWEAYPDDMHDLLARHDNVLRKCVEENGGRVFRTVGDAFYSLFDDSSQALKASLDIHESLKEVDWAPLPALLVRVGIHVGLAEPRTGDYYGPELNRVHRLMSAGHGGQTLVSDTTVSALGDHKSSFFLTDLGLRRLKDLAKPMRVFQLDKGPGKNEFPPLKCLDPDRHNLPVYRNPFFGRESETELLKGQLSSSGLVTLLGPGGIGKTRLACQVAAELVDSIDDGVWFVDLSLLADPMMVARALCQSTGLEPTPGLDVTDCLIDHLQGKRCLLILDNCEHVWQECARVSSRLTAALPELKLLATSREPLRLPAERVLSVPPLEPEGAATELFIERACLSSCSADSSYARKICQRLDGMPLAIELVASRSKSIPLSEMAARIDQITLFAKSGDVTAPERQQSLQKLFEWSYCQLSPVEKSDWCRLSVFHGQWDGALAAQVLECGEIEALDRLSSLVDRSLIVLDSTVQTPYRWLRPLREDSAARLGSDAKARSLHSFAFSSIAAWAADTQGPSQHERLDRLETHHSDLLSALEWAVGNERAEFASNLAWYWEVRGHWKIGLKALQDAANGATGKTKAKCLLKVAKIARRLGNLAEAEQAAKSARQLAEESSSPQLLADALNSLGVLAWLQGDLAVARKCLEQSVTLKEPQDDPEAYATGLHNIGVLCADSGDLASAIERFEAALELRRTFGDEIGQVASLNSLALCAADQGDHLRAVELAQDAISINGRLGGRLLAGALHRNLAVSLAKLGDLDHARCEFEAANQAFCENADFSAAAANLAEWGLLEFGAGDTAIGLTKVQEAFELAKGRIEPSSLKELRDRLAQWLGGQQLAEGSERNKEELSTDCQQLLSELERRTSDKE